MIISIAMIFSFLSLQALESPSSNITSSNNLESSGNTTEDIPFSFEILNRSDTALECMLIHSTDVLSQMSPKWFHLASEDPALSPGECEEIFTLFSGVRYRYSIGYDTGENYCVYIGTLELFSSSGESASLNIESDGFYFTEYGIKDEIGAMPLLAGYSTNPPTQPYLSGAATSNSIPWKTSSTAPTTPSPGWTLQYRIRTGSTGSWGA